MISDESTSEPIDLSRAPRGELAAARLVEAVAQSGDLAERHYLELKAPPDLSSKTSKAKVAKFILGAGNRLPDRAMAAFEGYGVMIVGVSKGRIEGIPPIEALALSQVVDPFLGAAGPRWDIVRVPVVGSNNEVLLILVEPPREGQPPFICRADGEGLKNGRIYYRADGETREATADEVDLLIARGQARLPAPVEIDVAMVGSVVPLIVDEATLSDLVATVRRRLLAALPRAPQASDGDGELTASLPLGFGASVAMTRMLAEQAALASKIASAIGMEDPETRSEDEYRAEIDTWEARLRQAWPQSVELFALHVLPGNEVKIASTTSTFLQGVQVKLHLEGDVEVGERVRLRPTWERLKLPSPPRPWGPSKRDLGFNSPLARAAFASLPYRGHEPPPSFSTSAVWKTTGSVEVVIDVGDLRPEAIFETSDGDSVLLVRGEVPDDVRGTWSATVRGYDTVFRGNIEVAVAESIHLTRLLRDFLQVA